MSTRSSKLKSDSVTNAHFPLSFQPTLEVMVCHKEIVTTVRQIGPSLFLGSIQLLCIKYHFIIKYTRARKFAKMERSHGVIEISHQGMKSIGYWTPTLTKCLHEILIIIICKQGGKDIIIKLSCIKEVFTSAKYLFPPLLVKWEIRKPFAHSKGKISIGLFCNYPPTQSIVRSWVSKIFVM